MMTRTNKPLMVGNNTIVGANFASMKQDKPVQGLYPSDCPALKYIYKAWTDS